MVAGWESCLGVRFESFNSITNSNTDFYRNGLAQRIMDLGGNCPTVQRLATVQGFATVLHCPRVGNVASGENWGLWYDQCLVGGGRLNFSPNTSLTYSNFYKIERLN